MQFYKTWSGKSSMTRWYLGELRKTRKGIIVRQDCQCKVPEAGRQAGRQGSRKACVIGAAE